MKKLATILASALLALAAGAPAVAGGDHDYDRDRDRDHESRPPNRPEGLSLDDHGFLFAGGKYVPFADDKIMRGQIYAEYFVPKKRTKKYPVIMVHGGGQTGTNFLKTPDGRDGWAHYFIREGYTVYVIDQPARGRSAYHPSVDGPLVGLTASFIEQRFTAPGKFPPGPGLQTGWPEAQLHNQWPGTGLRGDPTFDQFFASQVELVGSNEAENQAALAALLDKIGPAIVLTHSQSGPFGLAAAEVRPQLVKALFLIEPSGPPFGNAPAPWGPGTAARPWGMTQVPMTYSPPVTDPSQLNVVVEPSPDPSRLAPCKVQQEPARKLVKLKNIPVLLVNGGASYHRGYEYCTAKFLKQSGVSVDWISLEKVGIYGNNHMMMLEKNNARTAKLLLDWLDNRLGKDRPRS
jgi:pimeloyl-ACP methyl ester carboxylesterase